MSKLDDLLNSYAQEDEQASKLKSNYAVYRDDPESFSNVVDLSKKTGLPVTTVENNLPEARKRAAEPDWGSVQTEAPRTSELLAKDINFFRQAKNDVEGLKEIEKSFDQYKRTGAIESGFRGFMRGLGGLRELQGGRFQKEGLEYLVPKQEPKIGQDVFDKATKMLPPYLQEGEKQRLSLINDERQKRNQENIAKWDAFLASETPGAKQVREKTAYGLIAKGAEEIKAGQEFAKEWKADAYTESRSFIENLKDEPVKTTLTAIGEQAPNVVVSIVAGLVTRGLGTVGSVGSMGAVSYAMEGGDIFNEGTQYLEKKYGSFDKVPHEEWGKLLTLTNEHAAFNAVLDTVMPANLLKSKELKDFARKSLFGKVFSAEGLKEISKETIENLALELPTELVQETSSMAATEALGKEFTLEEKQNRYLQIAIGAGGIGAISGASKGVLNVAAAKPDQSLVFKGAMDEVQQQAKSTQEQGFLSRIFSAIESVKNKKILNQTIDNLSDTETENVYISAETVSTLFQDSDIPRDSKTAQAILEQVNKANALDGDVIIPLKDFIVDVQGTKAFEALRPHLRVSPGAMSQAEIDSGMGSERVKALIEEAEKHAEIKEAADEIYQTVRDQLIATGRLSPSAAGYSAQIIPAYVATQSARTGRTVAEIYRSMGLRIEGPERRAAEARPQATETQPDLLIQTNDRRKVQPGRGERRKAAEQVKRGILDKLSPEERQAMLKSDVIPSLGGLRAFEYHIKDTPDQRVMFLDFDDFKAVNDKLGEEETDIAILDPAGAIIAEAAEEAGIKAFHRSGDEFLAAGATDEQLDAFAKNLREKLKNADLVAILPDGTEDTFKSIGFSYGLGIDEKSARKLAKEQKAERKRTGERTGSRDSGVAGEASPGNEVQASSKQTLDQSLPQIQTPEFRRWFGASRVVDADGKPLVVYHGTPAGGFSEFSESTKGKRTGHVSDDVGLHFTDSPDHADAYSEGYKLESIEKYREMFGQEPTGIKMPPGATIYPVFLKIENPLTLKESKQINREMIDKAKADGYDGIIADMGGAKEYVAFRPEQIKSAIGNRGTFDPNDPNILNQPAYHGSPHKFDKFSLEAIGSGEGSQAYGWGLYFASNKAIAEFYRDKLGPGPEIQNLSMGSIKFYRNGEPVDYSPRESSDNASAKALFQEHALIQEHEIKESFAKDGPEGAERVIVKILDELIEQYSEEYGPYAKYYQDIRQKYDSGIMKVTADIKIETSNVYQVEVPDDGELLDLDAKLAEQPKKAQDAVRKILKESGHLRPNDNGPRQLTSAWKAFIMQHGGMSDGDSGATLYHYLEKTEGSAQAASEYLNKLGIPGSRYLDSNSRVEGKKKSYNYVIWDESTVTVEAVNDEIRQARELYQPPPPLDGHKRGHIQFDDEGAIIRMFDASDLSTFLHEAGHLFLNTEAKFAAIKPTAEHKAILDFLGAKDFQSITREQHETWARSFEAYLMEGKAPSLELRDAFSKFRDWLLQIYRSLTGLRVTLKPEITAIFDRMLATDEQIAIAHSDMNYGLMFKDIKSAGMTETEWAEYQKKKQRSKDKAISTLQEKILKELTRETEKWWKDELYAKRAEIREVLKERKVYKAIEFLKDSSGKNRLNRDTVKALLGVDILPSKFRKTTTTHGGLNPDEVAVVMGYESGHAMLMDILQNPFFTEAVNAEAEVRMKAEHGDILNDGTLEAQATEAVHDEARGEVLLTELRNLSRRTKRSMIDRNALKAQAHETISRAKLSEIRPDKYRKAEIRAARKAQKAFDSGDLAGAHQAKAQQIANFYLWREANEAKTTADKQRKYLAKIPNRKYDPKDVNPEYIRQMKLLSAVYDFRKGGQERSAAQLQAIATWLQTQTESEDTHVNPVIIDINLTNALQAIKDKQPIQVKHYNDMTVEELRGVHDMVKHLRYIGGKLSDNEKAVFAARTEKTAQSIIDNGTKVVIVPEEKSKRFDAMEKLRQLGQDHLGLANHIEELDGFKLFGPMFEEFYQGIINASNTELKFRREIGEKLQAAFNGFKSKDLREPGFIREGAGSKTITKQNGESWTLTARGRIMLALYWGSPESRAAIIEAHGTEQDVQKMLDFITDKEADLIQEIWNINESMWPHLRDTAIEMSGVSPPKVDHVPFKIGKREMPGGYMRIFYEEDVRDSVLLDVDSQGKIVRSGARVISNTKHGSRNSRVGSGGRKLSWDMDNVFRALDEVIHDVSFAKTASDTSRFLKSKPIREAITYRYGKEKYKAIQQTLSNVIAGKVDGGSGLLNTIMRVPRIAGTYAFLGYSVRNLIQQPIAMTNMLGRIGEKEVLSAAMDVYWHPKKWMEFVQERSEFIRNRTSLINRDISEAIGKIDSGVLSGPLKRHAFDLQTIGDAVAVYPGWVAAYRQGLDKFANEQKAITYADEVIAETIGSGMMKDMSPLLQGKAESAKGLGPEALKLFTFMYSYFNVVGRLTRSAAKRNNLKTIQGFSQYSREMAWYLIAPALIGAWIVGNGPEDDENWFAWAAKNIGIYRLAQFVGLRELTGLIQGYSPSTPITRALEGSLKAIKTSAEIAMDEKELDLANTAKILKGTASIVIIPGAGQAARTLDYIGSDPDEFDIYQALVIGK